MNCLAIAYEWLLEPQRSWPHDFTLVIAWCRTKGDAHEVCEMWHRAYHAKFPPPDRHLELTNVSGTLGLLWQTTDKTAQTRADAFERLLADAVVWSLCETDLSLQDENVVLIQGPLIPKLRGRLLYRGFDPRVPIFSVTHRPEWLQRIEATITSFAKLKEAKLDLSQVYPPKGIDRATRSWVCRVPGETAGEHPLHFEVIANMWDCRDGKLGGSWISDRERDIGTLTTDANLSSIEGDGVRLPKPLTDAIREARRWKLFEETFSKLRVCLEDEISVLKRNAASMPASNARQWRTLFGDGIGTEGRQGAVGQSDLEGISGPRVSFNCDVSYQHLAGLWKNDEAEVRRQAEQVLGIAARAIKEPAKAETKPTTRVTQKRFYNRLREICWQYQPTAERGRGLWTPFRRFHDEHESHEEDRAEILKSLEKYDLSALGPHKAYFNRGRETQIADKLSQISKRFSSRS